MDSDEDVYLNVATAFHGFVNTPGGAEFFRLLSDVFGYKRTSTMDFRDPNPFVTARNEGCRQVICYLERLIEDVEP